jgi:transposase
MKWLRQAILPGQDNKLLASELEFLEVLKQKISKNNGVVKKLARDDKWVKPLRSIPGLGPFFSVLVAKEIDDISRFRDEKKLCAYAGLMPSTYASGGKVFHGRITKTGDKWLRWAFIKAVEPAISCDADLFTCYLQLKMKKGTNATKVATARRLLTVAYRVLSQERLYERRNRMARRSLAPAALITS